MKPGRFVVAMLMAFMCFGFAAFFIGKIISTEKEYKEGEKAYDLIEELAMAVDEETSDENPESSSEVNTQNEDIEETAPNVNFEALDTLPGNAIGWLYLPDSVINYPVMQAEDNSYYLNHLADGSYNSNGSLFLDRRNASDFSDENSVIYGHYMRSGKMFGTLQSYSSQEYYETHPVIYLTTREGKYRIEVFSAYTTEKTSSAYTLKFATKAEYGEWLKEVATKSEIETNLHLSVDDHIITLSTCAYSFYDARYVVHGKLVKAE